MNVTAANRSWILGSVRTCSSFCFQVVASTLLLGELLPLATTDPLIPSLGLATQGYLVSKTIGDTDE